jgi:hypothetical protein
VPFEVLEEAVTVQKKLLENTATVKFEKSEFLNFLYNYLLHIRRQMWSSNTAESEGMYAVSQSLSDIIRDIGQTHTKGDYWTSIMKTTLSSALTKLVDLPIEESDTILSLIPGGEYGMITAGDMAVTNKGDQVVVLGYSEDWIKAQELEKKAKDNWDSLKANLMKMKLSSEFTSAKQMAICLFYNPDLKARQDLMVVFPSNLAPHINNSEEAIEAAKQNPLMELDILKKFIEILQMNGNSELVLKKS